MLSLFILETSSFLIMIAILLNDIFGSLNDGDGEGFFPLWKRTRHGV
jgi:hypothetical protein